MFRDRLPRHIEMFAELAKGLPVALEQSIKQLATTFIRQRFEYCIQLNLLYATFWLHVKRETFSFSGILTFEQV